MICSRPRSTLFPYTTLFRSVLEIMREDYVLVARAKGLMNRAVLWRHVLRNALIPIVTVVGLELGTLLSGSRSEEHTSELQSLAYLVCRLLLEKKNKHHINRS